MKDSNQACVVNVWKCIHVQYVYVNGSDGNIRGEPGKNMATLEGFSQRGQVDVEDSPL